MASAINGPIMIKQIVRLRNVVRRWKAKSLTRRRTAPCYFPSPPSVRTPAGCVAVYVGPERRRFVVPTRFLNLPVLVALLDQAEEEFGFPADGAIVLPCDAGFFHQILRLLDEDEARFAGFRLDQFLQIIPPLHIDSLPSSCTVPLLPEKMEGLKV
ncbi:indole-3-acetic acid-induced protein ARG7-like [Andrographis paniculata]|uniref:indole-3-acetic acid-induced protein ARG7-like n=1 Tax=Andrographis paniculata TaxID=175694 RepID=UPI0021E83FD4|nr:indole-3-acetic acid-induced protein ARG7-like [Andrographis paniculata]